MLTPCSSPASGLPGWLALTEGRGDVTERAAGERPIAVEVADVSYRMQRLQRALVRAAHDRGGVEAVSGRNLVPTLEATVVGDSVDGVSRDLAPAPIVGDATRGRRAQASWYVVWLGVVGTTSQGRMGRRG